MEKIKILWLVDGVGWGFDNLSRAIEKELPNYEHIMLSRDIRQSYDKTGGIKYECDNGVMKRVGAIKADMIISMNPTNIKFLRNKSKSIIRFSGERDLHGWRR